MSTCNIVLVVIAHSDDETLGMGGTIRRHVNKGDRVYAISMTDGVGSRQRVNDEDIRRRKESAIQASEYLGFTWVKVENFSDNAMDDYPLLEIVKSIENAKTQIQPDIVYTHSSADLNVDHRTLSQATLTAFRPQPGEKCQEIRLIEIPSATDYGHEQITGSFLPNLFVNIQNTWEAKESALKAYGREIKEYPHSRSVKAVKNLAKLRGNQVGIHLAEAFQVIRKIEH